ncbi:hypothetical protein GCM10029978_054220 [Actinoallomurus acanthiterrae]
MNGDAFCRRQHEVAQAGRELAVCGGTAEEWREYRRNRAIALSVDALENGPLEALTKAEEA